MTRSVVLNEKTMKWTRLILVVVAFATAIGAGVVVGRIRSQSETQGQAAIGDDDRIDYFSAPELVAASRVIVAGRVLGERDESFEFRSAATGDIAATLTEHLVTVEVTRKIKGELEVGARIAVVQTARNSRTSRTGEQRGSFEILPFSKSSEYVFFLVPVTMPPEFKPQETSTWGRPGEPGFALLNDNRLRFFATSGYAAKNANRGPEDADALLSAEMDIETLIGLAGQ